MRSIQGFNTLKENHQKYLKEKADKESNQQRQKIEENNKIRIQKIIDEIAKLENKARINEEAKNQILSNLIDEEILQIIQDEIAQKQQQRQEDYAKFRKEVFAHDPVVSNDVIQDVRLSSLSPNIREGVVLSLYHQELIQEEKERLEKEKLTKAYKKFNPEYKKLAPEVLEIILDEFDEKLKLEEEITKEAKGFYRHLKKSGSIDKKTYQKLADFSAQKIKEELQERDSTEHQDWILPQPPEFKTKLKSPNNSPIIDETQKLLEEVHSELFPALPKKTR